MNAVFFYGLFMDEDLLAERGFRPEVVGPAELEGYRLHIAERATLLQSPRDRAYGIVMELAEEEAEALYSEPSVRDYVAEQVQVRLLQTDQLLEADCYNLPQESGSSGSNSSYARQLLKLAESLQFEIAYLEEIAAFVGGSAREAVD